MEHAGFLKIETKFSSSKDFICLINFIIHYSMFTLFIHYNTTQVGNNMEGVVLHLFDKLGQN